MADKIGINENRLALYSNVLCSVQNNNFLKEHDLLDWIQTLQIGIDTMIYVDETNKYAWSF